MNMIVGNKFWLILTILLFRQNLLKKFYTIKTNTTIELCILELGYNQFHNILRLFDVLPNLPFTISDTICNYYL